MLPAYLCYCNVRVLEGKDPDKALVKEVENLKSIIGEMTIANEILIACPNFHNLFDNCHIY